MSEPKELDLYLRRVNAKATAAEVAIKGIITHLRNKHLVSEKELGEILDIAIDAFRTNPNEAVRVDMLLVEDELVSIFSPSLKLVPKKHLS